jgi:hypothetical protein
MSDIRTNGPKGDPRNLTPQPAPTGVKHDDGKIRYDLLPFDALHEVAKVYTEGAKKYDDRNWELGLDYGKVIAAALRHLTAFARGDSINKEDFGLHHLAHASWCCLALLAFELRGDKYKKFDDRVKTDKL